MIWKEAHGAIGCSRCAWFFTGDMNKDRQLSLIKIFEAHSCDHHPVTAHHSKHAEK